MAKILLLFIVLTVTNGLFVSDKTKEKLYTQFTGLINYLFGMEEEKPIEEDVTFYLHTRYNLHEGTKLTPNNYEKLRSSHFSLQLPTAFIIHGYTDHKDRDIIVALRTVLLNSLEMNVIVVDWQRLAAFIYFNAASHACRVGRYLAKFLQFLKLYGVQLSDIHLIGHSLGAQISGIAGENVDGKIGRITGLDPAGPLFEFIYTRNASESLDSGDALFVDVIHSSGKDFGIMFPVGHVDFYPNNGITPQPGCTNIFTAISCSHVRSVEYFIESINGTFPFLAKQCASFRDEAPTDCNADYSARMGYFTSLEARGIFSLKTNSKKPYAIAKIF